MLRSFKNHVSILFTFSHSSAALFSFLILSSSLPYIYYTQSKASKTCTAPRGLLVLFASSLYPISCSLEGAKEMNFNTINPDSMFIVVFITLRNAYTSKFFYFFSFERERFRDDFDFQEGSWANTTRARVFSRILQLSLQHSILSLSLALSRCLSVKYWFFVGLTMTRRCGEGICCGIVLGSLRRSFSHFFFSYIHFINLKL